MFIWIYKDLKDSSKILKVLQTHVTFCRGILNEFEAKGMVGKVLYLPPGYVGRRSDPIWSLQACCSLLDAIGEVGIVVYREGAWFKRRGFSLFDLLEMGWVIGICIVLHRYQMQLRTRSDIQISLSVKSLKVWVLYVWTGRIVIP